MIKHADNPGGVGNTIATSLTIPSTPGKITTLRWAHITNLGDATVWLHIYSTVPGLRRLSPGTPVQALESKTVLLDIESPHAIVLRAAPNADGTGASPDPLLLVSAAYEVEE